MPGADSRPASASRNRTPIKEKPVPKSKKEKKPAVKMNDLAAKKDPKGGDLTVTKQTNTASAPLMK